MRQERWCGSWAVLWAFLAALLMHPAVAGDLDDPAWKVGDGRSGERVVVKSANPPTLTTIVERRVESEQPLDARLYLPAGSGPHPAVVILPGSGGLRPAVEPRKIAALLDAGIGALMLDPFGRRGIGDTIRDQTRVSWAASVYDALAAYRHLAGREAVDAERIGAMGFSRGGYAAVQAAMRTLADPAIGGERGFRAVYGAYPWCGAQFRRPRVGSTHVRIIIGSHDDWASPVKCQAWDHAISLAGGRSSLRMVPGAHHAFDRHDEGVRELPEALTATRYPIWYIDERGGFRDYRQGLYHRGRRDAERQRRVEASGLAERGAHYGGSEDLARLLRADMLRFFRRTLKDGEQPRRSEP